MATITAVTPLAFGDGRQVTVTGSGFGTSGTVTIGGLAQSVTSWTDTAVVFTAVRGTQSMGPAVLNVVGAAVSNQTNLSAILYSQNFESGSIGASILTFPYFSTSNGVVENDPLSQQGKVISDLITAGQTGFGTWGFILNPFTSPLTSGNEAWFRIRLLFPTGFDYNSTGEGSHLKFIRFLTQTSSAANIGFDDIYLNPTTLQPPTWKFIYEGENNWNDFVSGNPPQINVWEFYEAHIVFDDVPVSTGGNARIDFWKNGVLIGSVTNRRTLNSDTDNCPSIYMFTYWNGGSPATQTAYYTDVAVAVKTATRDDRPYLATDSGGNKYIGTVSN